MATRVVLELSAGLTKAAEEFAFKEGVSLNQFIARALAEKVGARGTGAFFEMRGEGANPARAVAFLEGR